MLTFLHIYSLALLLLPNVCFMAVKLRFKHDLLGLKIKFQILSTETFVPSLYLVCKPKELTLELCFLSLFSGYSVRIEPIRLYASCTRRFMRY